MDDEKLNFVQKKGGDDDSHTKNVFGPVGYACSTDGS